MAQRLRSASLRSPQSPILKSLSVLTVSPFDDKERASECSCSKMDDGGRGAGKAQFAEGRAGLQSQFF